MAGIVDEAEYRFTHGYTSFSDEDEGDREGERLDEEEEEEDEEPLVAPSRQRTSSNLRRRLIKLKAGFHADKRGVADAFIDSGKNRPHYMKEEYSHDLLV